MTTTSQGSKRPSSGEDGSLEELLRRIRDGTLGDDLNVSPPPRVDGLRQPHLDPQDGKISINMRPQEPRDWVLQEILLAGKALVLGGLGGVSKTQLAIHTAVHVALGERFMGKEVASGNVLLILAEEDQQEISRRISAIARKRAFTEAQIAQVENRIRGFGLVGQDARLTVQQKGGLIETGFADRVIAAAQEMGGVRLIVLDHLALIHGGDFNAREDAALTMRVVNHVAKETGAAVMVLAHTPKSAADKEASDASMVAGSTAFVDQARGALVLAAMRKEEAKRYGISEDERHEYVSAAVVKNNYGPSGGVYWFKRSGFDGIGLLEHTTLFEPDHFEKKAKGLGEQVVAFVREHPGQFSKTALRELHSGMKGRFKSSKADLGAAIENQLGLGKLIIRPPTPEERERFGHGPQVTQVLDLPASD
jgi:AAA domain